MTEENKEEEVDLENIWGTDEDEEGEKKEEVEEEVVEEEEEEEEEEEVVEEKEEPNLALKARVRKREEENESIEQRQRQEANGEYGEDDFKESMEFNFSDNEIESDGENKKLKVIADDYPDVTALIKDAVGQVKKELGAKLETAQAFIDNETFWSKIEVHHPGARSMSDDKDFMTWMEADEDVKTLTSTGDPDDIVFVLDAWKKHNTPKVDERKEAKKNILKKSKGSTVSNKPADEEEKVTPELRKSIWG